MIFTTVHNHNKDILLGFLGDLTTRGALIIGEKPLERGQDITIRIEFQEMSGLHEESLIIPSHIAWCKDQEDGIYFHTGVEFKEITPHVQGVIESALKAYNFDEDIVL